MLSANEFKRLVRVEASVRRVDAPADLLDGISSIFVARGQTTHESIGTVIDLAQHEMARLGTAQKEVARSARADLVLGLTTPEAMVSVRQREESIRPAVEQLRRDYFRTTTAPFLSYEKAIVWLRSLAVIRQKPNEKQMNRLFADVREAMARFPNDYHLELSMGSHAIPLLAPKPGARQGSVVFDKGSALEKLKTVTESMSAGTGCDVPLCVAHVLTGAPLLLRPLDWSIEFSTGCGLLRRSATINILQPHAITLPVLAQAYRKLRKELGLANKKTMMEWHEQLLRLVEKHGGVPRRGKRDFWEGIQRTWNQAVPQGGRRYETWMGPKMAYDRLQRALKNR
ncbi:MAG: hypothetical protein MRJ68_02105 [Nitrospira sp.]|nr:hypothetical protein [Nitrospira sp.]